MRIKVSDNQKFALRVAGIFMRDHAVLLHRADFEDLWALPGGGCDFDETTQAALKREAQEELGASIKILSLAFTVENFFTYSEFQYHEVGFYYFAEFSGESRSFYEPNEFVGIEEKMDGQSKFKLLFQWVPLNQIEAYNLKPSFLKEKLQSLNSQTQHVVHRENQP